MMSPIAHGGGLAQARRCYPNAGPDWLDLSTGINPSPYPLPPLPPAALARLPEPEALAVLEAAAAGAYGLADPACVAAAPGSQALIHLLPRLMPPCDVAVLSPTYAEHAAAWRGAGHRVAEVSEFSELARATVVVVCRPNNPDGQIADATAILSLADQLVVRGGLVVVDEAFADFENCSLATALPHPCLLLLRSFGKPYGLAGVRLGFALASIERAAALRNAQGPWAVSGVAIHAGTHALPDIAWRNAMAGRLACDASRLDRTLGHAGLRVLGGTVLFRLAHHPQAAVMAERLAQRAILVRRFADRPEMLRFGLPGSAEQWERLQVALA